MDGHLLQVIASSSTLCCPRIQRAAALFKRCRAERQEDNFDDDGYDSHESVEAGAIGPGRLRRRENRRVVMLLLQQCFLRAAVSALLLTP